MKKIEGKLVLNDQRIAIVASRFNELVTSKLLGGAVDCLQRHGLQHDCITEVWVPGAFEIPFAAKQLCETNKFDGVICLGAVIRGGTPHFDYVCSSVTRGIGDLNLKYNIPVTFGVLTTDSIEQAIERAGTKAGNKGWEAAMAQIETLTLADSIRALTQA
jgi:6,7-dimethyl-8-ribityllumazine synthase